MLTASKWKNYSGIGTFSTLDFNFALKQSERVIVQELLSCKSFPVSLCETLETALMKFIGEAPKSTCGVSILADFSTAISWVFVSRIYFCFEHFIVSSKNLRNIFSSNAADIYKYSVLSSNSSHMLSDRFCGWTLSFDTSFHTSFEIDPLENCFLNLGT